MPKKKIDFRNGSIIFGEEMSDDIVIKTDSVQDRGRLLIANEIMRFINKSLINGNAEPAILFKIISLITGVEFNSNVDFYNYLKLAISDNELYELLTLLDGVQNAKG